MFNSTLFPLADGLILSSSREDSIAHHNNVSDVFSVGSVGRGSMAREAGVSHDAHQAEVVSSHDEVATFISTDCVDVSVVFVRVVDALDVPSELSGVSSPEGINGVRLTVRVLLELRDREVE